MWWTVHTCGGLYACGGTVHTCGGLYTHVVVLYTHLVDCTHMWWYKGLQGMSTALRLTQLQVQARI